ncbi:myelin and lymphocyte protein-like [Equus quagga]|uniref:myelin and lymphocyte protein-like n=1 Tax=Equus quagga TaxID=89248 RepID=UPI001EE1FBA8|nr:myelin and lymphocyte protein-like [Equus quagga]
MDDRPLPSGIKVFTTFPDALLIFEFVFGGLVWILIASSQVPLPLIQGWVMFVSVFCFVGTTILFFLYVTGIDDKVIKWIDLDVTYHCLAAVLYFSLSVLEALAVISMEDGFTYEHFLENIAAAVFSYVATLLYMVHAVFSLIRWKKAAKDTQWESQMVITLRPPYSFLV